MGPGEKTLRRSGSLYEHYINSISAYTRRADAVKLTQQTFMCGQPKVINWGPDKSENVVLTTLPPAFLKVGRRQGASPTTNWMIVPGSADPLAGSRNNWIPHNVKGWPMVEEIYRGGTSSVSSGGRHWTRRISKNARGSVERV